MKRARNIMTFWLIIGALGISTAALARRNSARGGVAADAPADVSKHVAGLRSTDATQRAAAACSLRKMGARAAARGETRG
jgi:hypothetical protein